MRFDDTKEEDYVYKNTHCQMCVIMHHIHWLFSNYIIRNLLDTRTSKVWKILVRGRRYSTMSSSRVKSTTLLYTNDLSRENTKLVNCTVMKLSKELKKIKHHLKREVKMDEFNLMCKDLFIYPPDLTYSVPALYTSSLVATSSDTQSTPVKIT